MYKARYLNMCRK